MRTTNKKNKRKLRIYAKNVSRRNIYKKISEIIGIGYGTANNWLKEMNIKF